MPLCSITKELGMILESLLIFLPLTSSWHQETIRIKWWPYIWIYVEMGGGSQMYLLHCYTLLWLKIIMTMKCLWKTIIAKYKYYPHYWINIACCRYQLKWIIISASQEIGLRRAIKNRLSLGRIDSNYNIRGEIWFKGSK